MKILRTLTAWSLALGLAAIASAQTDIYVCGSTAFRTAVVNSEITVLSNGGAPGTAHIGGTVQSATVSAVQGTDSNGNAIVFHNHWTGSVAGVTDISNANPLSAIPDASVPAQGAGDVTLATGADTANVVPQVAMSDNVVGDAVTVLSNANAAGKTFATGITNAGPIDGGTAAGSNGGPVAAVTFEWVLGAISGGQPTPVNWAAAPSSSLTATGALPFNITQDIASALLTTGSIPLSVVTGNNADAANFLLMIGRNEDSGSRVLYQAESWSNGTPTSHGAISGGTLQWMIEQSTTPGGAAIASGYPTSSSGAGYPALAITGGITALKKWPASWTLNTETTVTWTSLGHSGYNGGGDVADILSSPSPVTNLTFSVAGQSPTGYAAPGSQLYIVSCLGTSDAATVLSHGGTALAYNGVPYSVANIENGQYSLWNQEHLYLLPTLGGVQLTGANELADQIFNNTAGQLGSAGIPLSLFNASRGLGAGAQIK